MMKGASVGTRWRRLGARPVALAGGLTLIGCNPVPEGPSLLNPPTDTCDLTLSRPEDCALVQGRFAYGQCIVAPAAVCEGEEGRVEVTFFVSNGLRSVTVAGQATCRTGAPVPACE